MFNWNSDKITKDLKGLNLIKNVVSKGPGGDVDTDNLHIKLHGSKESLYVCGFNAEPQHGPNVAVGKEYITDPTDCDVEMVELTDKHGHGLQSDDFVVAQAYIIVRQYFLGRDVTVINNLKDYF